MKLFVTDFYEEIKTYFEEEINFQNSLKQKLVDCVDDVSSLRQELHYKKFSRMNNLDSFFDTASIEVIEYILSTYQLNLVNFNFTLAYRRNKDTTDQTRYVELCTEYGACVQVPQVGETYANVGQYIGV